MYMQILFNSVIFMQKGHKWFSELFSGDNANGDPLKGGSHRRVCCNVTGACPQGGDGAGPFLKEDVLQNLFVRQLS